MISQWILHSDDRVVSLGLIILDTILLRQASLSFDFCHLIFDPGKKSHIRAEEVHGWDDWTLRHQEPFRDHAQDLSGMIASTGMVIAHNVEFDLRFINREFELANLPAIATASGCTMLGWRESGRGGSASLDAICSRLGAARNSDRHSALEDGNYIHDTLSTRFGAVG